MTDTLWPSLSIKDTAKQTIAGSGLYDLAINRLTQKTTAQQGTKQ
jgi:hypothetical protein